MQKLIIILVDEVVPDAEQDQLPQMKKSLLC